ncbi:unnamed protein product [Ectocarpus sp. 8 AP-2014]
MFSWTSMMKKFYVRSILSVNFWLRGQRRSVLALLQSASSEGGWIIQLQRFLSDENRGCEKCMNCVYCSKLLVVLRYVAFLLFSWLHQVRNVQFPLGGVCSWTDDALKADVPMPGGGGGSRT